MKRFALNKIFFLLFILMNEQINAQWQWAQGIGGSEKEYGLSSATDANGNFYAAFNFRSASITIGSYTLTNSGPVGTTDAALAKYDPSGNVIWARKGGGSYADGCKKICVDNNGNVYMVGYYYSTGITFGSYTLTNANSNTLYADIFLAKYDPSGTVLWLKGASGGMQDERAYGISTDTSGNVVITGEFTSTSFSFGTYTLTNSGSSDVFIAKYNSAGNVAWAKKAGNSSIDIGEDIVSAPNGTFYVTGYFSSTSLAFGTNTLTNNGGYDIFLAKYDSSGTNLWVRNPNGVNNEFPSYIIIDANENPHITGGFLSPTVTFGTFTVTNADNTNSTRDIYVAKYDSSGTALWASSAGGVAADEGYAVFVDPGGNVFITGYFVSNGITFGTYTLSNAGQYDVFVAKYNAAGNPLWAVGTGGSNVDEARGICVNNTGSIFVVGHFRSASISFGSTTLTSAGMDDAFVAVLGLATGMEQNIDNTGITVFPNPSGGNFTISAGESISEVEVFNVIGESIFFQRYPGGPVINVSLPDFPKGVHIMKVASGNKVAIKKILIQ